DTAAAHLAQAEPLAQELGSAWWISYNGAYSALTHLQLGQIPQARAQVAQAARALGVQPDWSARAPASLTERYLAWAWAETAVANGQRDRPLAAADHLLESAINPGGEPIPNLLRLKAGALAALGRPGEAEAALRFALQGAQANRMRLVLWRLHADLAR